MRYHEDTRVSTTTIDKSPPLIEYNNVTVVRNGRKVLDGISLSIAAGEHVAILGPNGAGKSSLIKTITRDLHPVADDHGSYLRILGKENWNVTDLRNRLGIVSPEAGRSAFGNFSCGEVVLSGFFASAGIWPLFHDVTAGMRRKANAVMRLMGVFDLRAVRINEVSTGESRRVTIARALVNDPSTMLLDEPTSSLDVQAARTLGDTMRKIARQGKGIVMITHNLSDIIPEIQRVVLIRDGKVVGDGKKEDLLTVESLSALFGVTLDVVKRDGYYYCW